MAKHWQFQEAKNKLSEVIDSALRDGPQTITRRGKPVAVVVSAAKFSEWTRPATSLVDFFRHSPLVGVKIDLTRSPDPTRDVDIQRF